MLRAIACCLTLHFLFSSVIIHAEEKKGSAFHFQNTGSSPEAVVKAFLKLDEEGFIWAGMSDFDRRALTTWKEAPTSETYYRYQSRSVSPPQKNNPEGTEVKVKVTWSLVSHQDGFGTQLNLPKSKKTQHTFVLKKEGALWRIHTPSSTRYIPLLKMK